MNRTEKSSPMQTQPYTLHREEGSTFQTADIQVLMKASADQTSGAFNLFEIVCPVGFATLLHIHYLEDVAIYVLDGALTFFWGEAGKEAKPGTYFFQPKGTPHGFRVKGELPARILYMTIPAGLDQFVIEPARSMDSSGFFGAAEHKIEVLGPLPDQ